MLTTVTTTTTTTVVAMSHVAVFGAIGVVVLITLLIAKELLGSYGDESEGESGRGEEAKGLIMDINIKAKSLATSLSVAIYPLLFSFAVIVVVKVAEVL